MRAAFDRKSMAAIQETIESRRVASPNYLVEPVVSPPPPPPVSLSRASFRAKSENDVLAEVTAWPMKSLHRPGLGMDSSPAAATTLAARRKLALLRLPISDSSHEAVELKTFRTKLAAIEKRMLAAAAVEDIAAVTECLAEVGAGVGVPRVGKPECAPSRYCHLLCMCSLQGQCFARRIRPQENSGDSNLDELETANEPELVETAHKNCDRSYSAVATRATANSLPSAKEPLPCASGSFQYETASLVL